MPYSTSKYNERTIRDVIPEFEFKPCGNILYAYQDKEWLITKTDWSVIRIKNKKTGKDLSFESATTIILPEDIEELAKT